MSLVFVEGVIAAVVISSLLVIILLAIILMYVYIQRNEPSWAEDLPQLPDMSCCKCDAYFEKYVKNCKVNAMANG